MALLVNSAKIEILQLYDYNPYSCTTITLQLYDYSLYSRTTTTLQSYNYRVFDQLEAENREFEMLKTPYFVARFQVCQYAKFGYNY